VAAGPVAVASSWAGLGRWLRRAGVLVTPEERRAPAILREVLRDGAGVELGRPAGLGVLAAAEGD